MGPVKKGLKPVSHARIQNFCVEDGGGVVQGRLLENSLNNVFFLFHQLFIVYRGDQIVYQWFYFRGNYFSQVSGGVPSLIQGGPRFSRGSSFFQGGGSKCYFL